MGILDYYMNIYIVRDHGFLRPNTLKTLSLSFLSSTQVWKHGSNHERAFPSFIRLTRILGSTFHQLNFSISTINKPPTAQFHFTLTPINMFY